MLQEQISRILVDAREFADRVGSQREWFVASHNFKQKFLLIRSGLGRVKLDVERFGLFRLQHPARQLISKLKTIPIILIVLLGRVL